MCLLGINHFLLLAKVCSVIVPGTRETAIDTLSIVPETLKITYRVPDISLHDYEVVSEKRRAMASLSPNS